MWDKLENALARDQFIKIKVQRVPFLLLASQDLLAPLF
jgi:hypothetical protein